MTILVVRYNASINYCYATLFKSFLKLNITYYALIASNHSRERERESCTNEHVWNYDTTCHTLILDTVFAIGWFAIPGYKATNLSKSQFNCHAMILSDETYWFVCYIHVRHALLFPKEVKNKNKNVEISV